MDEPEFGERVVAHLGTDRSRRVVWVKYSQKHWSSLEYGLGWRWPALHEPEPFEKE